MVLMTIKEDERDEKKTNNCNHLCVGPGTQGFNILLAMLHVRYTLN